MKKSLLLVFVLFLSLTLFACSDSKTYDDSISVYFFTSNTGATLVETEKHLAPGDLIVKPDDPTRVGYAFDKWYKDFLKTEAWDFDNDRVGESSLTLYAGWVPVVYNITYDPNGGLMPSSAYPTTFTVGSSSVLPVPSRLGYTFVAWYFYDWEDVSSTIPGDSGYQITPTSQPGDITLYAHWSPAIINVTFVVNYPVAGGPSTPNSQTVYYGDEVNFPTMDDTALYTFLGWNSRSDGSGTWYVNGDIFTRTQRTSVYGIWEAKS